MVHLHGIMAAITRGGLKYILGREEMGGDILITEKEMIRRIIDFPEVTAGRIMSPLSTMTALPATTTIREAARLAQEKKDLHIPVYQDRIFNITGILDYFDLMESLYGQDTERERDAALRGGPLRD